MKKLLSLLLIVSMLVSVCLCFSACGVSPKEVEADPQAAVNEAMKTATESFFEDNDDMAKIVEEAIKTGSVNIHFENEADTESEKTVVDETLYFNESNKSYVSDLSMTMGEEVLSARLFLDRNGLAVNSEAFFGTKNTYALNLATLEQKIGENGMLQQILGIETADDLVITTTVINRLRILYDALFSETAEEDLAELTNEIYRILNYTVTTETVEPTEGKSVKCLVTTMTLNNESYAALVNLFLTKLKLTEADIDALNLSPMEKMALKQVIEGIGEDVVEGKTNYNITQRVYMNKRTGALIKNEVEGTITEKDGTLGTVRTVLECSKDRISLDAEVDVTDTKLDLDVTLTKEKEKKNVIYKIEVNGGDGNGATVNFLNATLTYAKDTDTFEVVADVYQKGKSRLEMSASGSVSVNEDEAKIELNSYTEKGERKNIKASVCFKKTATAPERPAEVTDLADMKKSDWQDFMQKIQESKLGSLIFGMLA